MDRVAMDVGEGVLLGPGQAVIATSEECVVVADDMVGQVFGSARYGRLGLIAGTSQMVGSGFSGCVTIEIVNLGRSAVVLRTGDRIGQLILITVPGQRMPR